MSMDYALGEIYMKNKCYISIIVLIAVLTGLVFVGAVTGQSSGVEFNAVSIVVPSELLGSFQTFIVPLNVSSLLLLSESNVYIVAQGVPRISYLFSRNPPVIAFVEASAYSGTYEVWYGGGNPYSELIGTPGSTMSFWLAYDDFDYATGYWVNTSIQIAGSRAYIEPGGYLALTQPYSPKTAHLWLLHGRKALVITLPEPRSDYIYMVFTEANFTDITTVIDGSDIFFVDNSGKCLSHGVIYFDKNLKTLHVIVNPEENTVIYMGYGGENPCTAHRVE